MSNLNLRREENLPMEKVVPSVGTARVNWAPAAPWKVISASKPLEPWGVGVAEASVATKAKKAAVMKVFILAVGIDWRKVCCSKYEDGLDDKLGLMGWDGWSLKELDSGIWDHLYSYPSGNLQGWVV